jgi:hypothetical protein
VTCWAFDRVPPRRAPDWRLPLIPVRFTERPPVFTPEQYREKPAEYAELAKQDNALNEVRELQLHERSLSTLADNEQWLADNQDRLANNIDELLPLPELSAASKTTLPAEEEHIIRCLGAALIMQWDTLPTGLQRELFDNAGSMGELLDVTVLRGQIARFLHKRAHAQDEVTLSSVQSNLDRH